jgi:hypothetical protein
MNGFSAPTRSARSWPPWPGPGQRRTRDQGSPATGRAAPRGRTACPSRRTPPAPRIPSSCMNAFAHSTGSVTRVPASCLNTFAHPTRGVAPDSRTQPRAAGRSPPAGRARAGRGGGSSSAVLAAWRQTWTGPPEPTQLNKLSINSRLQLRVLRGHQDRRSPAIRSLPCLLCGLWSFIFINSGARIVLQQVN